MMYLAVNCSSLKEAKKCLGDHKLTGIFGLYPKIYRFEIDEYLMGALMDILGEDFNLNDYCDTRILCDMTPFNNGDQVELKKDKTYTLYNDEWYDDCLDESVQTPNDLYKIAKQWRTK